MAIETSFRFLFTQIQTPRFFLLEGSKIDAGDVDEQMGLGSELEMNGWDLGGSPDTLPENEDDEHNIEPGNVGDACN